MQDAAESGRLEHLRRRAYGRGAALTADEAAELHDLEHALRAQRAAERSQSAAAVMPAAHPRSDAAHADGRAAVASVDESAAGATATGAPDADEAGSEKIGESGESGESDSGAESNLPEPTGRPWRRRAVAGVAVMASVAVGIGIGWLWSPDVSARPAMSAEQGQTLAELEESGWFDSGTVELLGEQDGASLWVATGENQELDCIALTRGGQKEYQCLPTDDVAGQGRLSAVVVDVVEGVTTQFWASLVTDVQGRRTGLIQVMSMEPAEGDWSWAFTDEEKALGEQLEAAGLELSALSIIGYDGDTPIWMTQGYPSCLAVVDGGTVEKTCADDYYAGDTLTLVVGSTSYEVYNSANRGLQLSIVESVPVEQCASGESAGEQTCTTIDDKTGDTTSE